MSQQQSLPRFHADLDLVRAALSGERKAWEGFFTRIADSLWTACLHLGGDDDVHVRESFLAVEAALRANNFQRLRVYDGSSRIETYVLLVARDVLAEHLLALFHSDTPADGWAAFERFFRADILRLVSRRLPGDSRGDERSDAYQDICLALIANDYRRLKAYSGQGSFTGFVLHTIDHLLIDIIRRTLPRRRLPAAIQRLGELDQAVYRAVYWQGAAAETASILATLPMVATAQDVAAALERVRCALPAGYDGKSDGPARMVPLDECDDRAVDDDGGPSSPEDIMMEREAEYLLTLAADILREAAETLTDTEHLYLRIILGSTEPLAAREIARLMRRPVEEIYKLKQRVMTRLRAILKDDPNVRAWRASVS